MVEPAAEIKTTFLQSAHWRQLVAQMRAVYSGKITVAGYLDSIDWWDVLDYIGIEGYGGDGSSRAALEANWQQKIQQMIPAVQKYNKTLIITEVGMQSRPAVAGQFAIGNTPRYDAADCSIHDMCVNETTQALGYQVQRQKKEDEEEEEEDEKGRRRRKRKKRRKREEEEGGEEEEQEEEEQEGEIGSKTGKEKLVSVGHPS